MAPTAVELRMPIAAHRGPSNRPADGGGHVIATALASADRPATATSGYWPGRTSLQSWAASRNGSQSAWLRADALADSEGEQERGAGGERDALPAGREAVRR